MALVRGRTAVGRTVWWWDVCPGCMHTHSLAGTILASNWRSQIHHRSFQEGQPQSHCTGVPTGGGAPEGARQKMREQRVAYRCECEESHEKVICLCTFK